MKSVQKFIIPWKTGKGNFLKMTEEFSNLFPKSKGEIPFIVQDQDGQKFSVIYNHETNQILIQGLISWVRNYDPPVGANLIFELLDHEQLLFNLTLDKEIPPPPDGLYLGKSKDRLGKYLTDKKFFLPTQDLVTHVFICGVTGTGKTVMGKSIIEEAILKGIPSIIVDLKGDLSSLGLIFSSLEEPEFTPWVEVQARQNHQNVVQAEVEQYKENLAEFGLSTADMEKLRNKASFAVFTPKAGKGIPLAIASPLAAPPDIAELIETDYDTVLSMIGAFSATFIKTLFPEAKTKKLSEYKSFLEAIVLHCWKHGVDLQGQNGLYAIQEMIQNPPMQYIGGLPIGKFINEKERTEFAKRVAMNLSGEQQLWFKGIPLNIDILLSRPSTDTVPVSIINLRELATFDDQMHALSHLTYALFEWVRRKGEVREPRLLFFIDEIAGGGGRNAFFPSHPYDPPSKSGLNVLLRKGRAFGLSCIFATQNPGDVDYKGLSNCQTWMISRLQTDRDRKKIREGMTTAEIYRDSADDKLQDLQPNEFLVMSKGGKITVIQERWLMSYHKTLSESEIAKVNQPQLVEWFTKNYSSKPSI